ncbi:MAG: threonine synthase, partial [Calditrichota bacterium]
MKFYSTKNKQHLISLREAVLQGLPPDNGLYMPTEIPELPVEMIHNLKDMPLPEIAVQVLSPFLKEELSKSSILEIAESAFNFDAPLVQLDENLHTLELFHGPTLAFKDFAARFMARLIGNFIEESQQRLTILVATSGDTGSAVAQGFYEVPGIDVVVLYPSGKVSPLQEKQMTTLGGNISVLEVNGSFDDCQALVKKAFLDAELRESRALSSANSINIARLLPQTIYYFRALAQLPAGRSVLMSVPSGNFGNLTAGVLSCKMGLPIEGLIAATNVNDIVPNYIYTGTFQPRPSLATLSNAMDVGNPSNFPRLLNLCNNSHTDLRRLIDGAAFSDEE